MKSKNKIFIIFYLLIFTNGFASENYFDNAIADAEFITPKQILIGQGIEKVRKNV